MYVSLLPFDMQPRKQPLPLLSSLDALSRAPPPPQPFDSSQLHPSDSQIDLPQYNVLHTMRMLPPFVPAPNRRMRRATAWSRSCMLTTLRRPLRIACATTRSRACSPRWMRSRAHSSRRSRSIRRGRAFFSTRRCCATRRCRRALLTRPCACLPPPQLPPSTALAGVDTFTVTNLQSSLLAGAVIPGQAPCAATALQLSYSTCATSSHSCRAVLRFLVDGGSNANFTYDKRLLQCSAVVNASGSISAALRVACHTRVCYTVRRASYIHLSRLHYYTRRAATRTFLPNPL